MTPLKPLAGICLLIAVTLVTGCSVKKAYFFSPFNATAPSYHTTPLQIDSVSDALYGGLVIGTGGANDRLIDQMFLLRPSFYASHARENCQFYYGADLMIGNYEVSRYDTSYISTHPNVNAKLINENAGSKYFGGVGFNAGVNYTVQFRDRHEFRIGTESSYKYEFGDYLNFRRKLPDTAATGVHRNRHFVTLGIYSELAFKFRNGSIGFKLSIGTPLGREFRSVQTGSNYDAELFPFPYVSPVFQYTNRRLTCFVQLNGSTKAFHTMFGTSYRLAAISKKRY